MIMMYVAKFLLTTIWRTLFFWFRIFNIVIQIPVVFIINAFSLIWYFNLKHQIKYNVWMWIPCPYIFVFPMGHYENIWHCLINKDYDDLFFGKRTTIFDQWLSDREKLRKEKEAKVNGGMIF